MSNEVTENLRREVLDFTTEVENMNLSNFDKEYDNIHDRLLKLTNRVVQANAIFQAEEILQNLTILNQSDSKVEHLSETK